MKRGYKYKIKPTFKQQKMLQVFFGSTRFIYNWGLDRKIKAYKNNKQNLTYIQLAKELTLLKENDDFKWLKQCANESLQQSLRCLDRAYTNFFKAKQSFPKFKSKKKSKNVCKFINNVHIDFKNNKIKVPKIGWVKFYKNEVFDINSVKIGTLTIEQDKCGDYWCSIVVDNGIKNKSKTKICEETAIGIDLGIKDYIVLSNGTKFANEDFLMKNHKKLKKLQQKFNKTKINSKNHEYLRIKIARLHRKIVNQRVNYLHQLTNHIIQNYDTICLENLNIKGMMKNHNISKKIQSAAWGEFIRQIIYKSNIHGKNVVFIGRFEPSTQICSSCGYRFNETKNLKIREWVCPECGEKHDRDINAAKNIKNFGLHSQALIAINKKIPSVSGIKGVEGKDDGLPLKR